MVGDRVGATVVGERVIDSVGEAVLGESVGESVVGEAVGDTDGETVLGEVVGDMVEGDTLGERVGALVVGEAVAGPVGDVVVGDTVGETVLGEALTGAGGSGGGDGGGGPIGTAMLNVKSPLVVPHPVTTISYVLPATKTTCSSTLGRGRERSRVGHTHPPTLFSHAHGAPRAATASRRSRRCR